MLSPSHVGEDSFFHFMSRMVRVYMREDEVRAKHQSALLQLREDAIKEKTKVGLVVGLDWLFSLMLTVDVIHCVLMLSIVLSLLC